MLHSNWTITQHPSYTTQRQSDTVDRLLIAYGSAKRKKKKKKQWIGKTETRATLDAAFHSREKRRSLKRTDQPIPLAIKTGRDDFWLSFTYSLVSELVDRDHQAFIRRPFAFYEFLSDCRGGTRPRREFVVTGSRPRNISGKSTRTRNGRQIYKARAWQAKCSCPFVEIVSRNGETKLGLGQFHLLHLVPLLPILPRFERDFLSERDQFSSSFLPCARDIDL